MKFINYLLIIFITLPSLIKADSSELLINELKEGGKLVFIRHAYAPGGGDPDDFDIKDCSTQRNLDNKDENRPKKLVIILRTIKYQYIK